MTACFTFAYLSPSCDSNPQLSLYLRLKLGLYLVQHGVQGVGWTGQFGAMTALPSIRSLTLHQPPSCIAFCPTQPQYFVVGTYFLHDAKDQQQRQQRRRQEADPATNNVESQRPCGCEAEEASRTHSCPSEVVPQERSGSLILFRLVSDGFDDSM